ncbi:MAG TPA: hypothetical protein DEO82_02395 [Eubacterium sp.]|nr:hypothetical protein [Eubacterium sp.]
MKTINKHTIILIILYILFHISITSAFMGIFCHISYLRSRTYGSTTYMVETSGRNDEKIHTILDLHPEAYWGYKSTITNLYVSPSQSIYLFYGRGLPVSEGRWCQNGDEIVMYGNYKIGDTIPTQNGDKTVVGIIKKLPSIEPYMYSPYMDYTSIVPFHDYYFSSSNSFPYNYIKACGFQTGKLSQFDDPHILVFDKSQYSEEEFEHLSHITTPFPMDNADLPFESGSVYFMPVFSILLFIIIMVIIRRFIISHRRETADRYMYLKLHDLSYRYKKEFTRDFVLTMVLVQILPILLCTMVLLHAASHRLIYMAIVMISFVIEFTYLLLFEKNELALCCPEVDALYSKPYRTDKNLLENLIINYETTHNYTYEEALEASKNLLFYSHLNHRSSDSPGSLECLEAAIFDLLLKISNSRDHDYTLSYDFSDEEEKTSITEFMNKLSERMNICITTRRTT